MDVLTGLTGFSEDIPVLFTAEIFGLGFCESSSTLLLRFCNVCAWFSLFEELLFGLLLCTRISFVLCFCSDILSFSSVVCCVFVKQCVRSPKALENKEIRRLYVRRL